MVNSLIVEGMKSLIVTLQVHYVRLSQPSGALSCFCSPWLPAQSQLRTLDSVGAVCSCSPCLCSYFCQTARGSVQLGFISVSGTYASENSGESQATGKPNLIIFCSCSKVSSYVSSSCTTFLWRASLEPELHSLLILPIYWASRPLRGDVFWKSQCLKIKFLVPMLANEFKMDCIPRLLPPAYLDLWLACLKYSILQLNCFLIFLLCV